MSGIRRFEGQPSAPRFKLPNARKVSVVKRRYPEFEEQCNFMTRVRMDHRTRFLLIYAVPNSSLIGKEGGKTAMMRMVRAKAAGLMPGWPDINVDEPKTYWPKGFTAGLRLEFKRDPDAIGADGKKKREKAKPEQEEIHSQLRRRGYRVEVVYNAAEGWSVLCDYLGIPENAERV